MIFDGHAARRGARLGDGDPRHPEMDLAWSIFLDRHHSEGVEVPRLEGFPSYEETLARYQALTGHRVRQLHF